MIDESQEIPDVEKSGLQVGYPNCCSDVKLDLTKIFFDSLPEAQQQSICSRYLPDQTSNQNLESHNQSSHYLDLESTEMMSVQRKRGHISFWSQIEKQKLSEGVLMHGQNLNKLAAFIATRDTQQVRNHLSYMKQKKRDLKDA